MWNEDIIPWVVWEAKPCITFLHVAVAWMWIARPSITNIPNDLTVAEICSTLPLQHVFTNSTCKTLKNGDTIKHIQRQRGQMTLQHAGFATNYNSATHIHKILCFWQQFKLPTRAPLSISLSHLQGKGAYAAREKWHPLSPAKAHNTANYNALQCQNERMKGTQVPLSLPHGTAWRRLSASM